MQFAETIVVTAEMKNAAAGLLERLGPATVTAAPTWRSLAVGLGLSERDELGDDDAVASIGSPASVRASVIVGSLASVIKHAADQGSEFGFVMPIAQTARWWQRVPSWRDEAMLELWQSGWTPVAVDRLTTVKQDAGVEFAIGNARPTPTSTVSSR